LGALIRVEQLDDVEELVLKARCDHRVAAAHRIGPEEGERPEDDLDAARADESPDQRRLRLQPEVAAERALQVGVLHERHRCRGPAEHVPVLLDAAEETLHSRRAGNRLRRGAPGRAAAEGRGDADGRTDEKQDSQDGEQDLRRSLAPRCRALDGRRVLRRKSLTAASALLAAHSDWPAMSRNPTTSANAVRVSTGIVT